MRLRVPIELLLELCNPAPASAGGPGSKAGMNQIEGLGVRK